MLKTKTLLAVAILALIALTGYSQAQTTTGTTVTSDTVALTPTQVLSGSAKTLGAAKDWDGLIALAQPNVIGKVLDQKNKLSK